MPISRHPLFPAIVALWFGALFGLGSLAVRPTLLEELVLAGGIDTLVPAAAPPLGLTARILLALGMALLGGVIGATVARRIARPKPELRQRRRGATTSAGTTRGYANSASGHEFFDKDAYEDDDDDDLAFLSPNKRRSLAISENVTPLELREFAPLPGGGAPQILNVSDVAAEPIRPGPPRTMVQPQAPEAFEMAPLAPAHVRDQESRLPDAASPHEAIARLERTFAVPQAEELELFEQPDTDDTARRFDRAGTTAQPPFAQPASLAPPQTMPIAAAQSFGAPDAPARPFAQPGRGQPAFAPPVPKLASQSLADAAPPAPRFTAPVAPSPEPAAEVAVKREPIALAGHVPLFGEPEPQVAEPPAVAPEQPAAAKPDPVAAPPSSPAFTLPQGAAARQLTGAELDVLSPVQLVERLALSIQRRRERAVADAATTVAAPAASESRVAPAAVAAPIQPAPPSAIPQQPARPPIVPAPMAMPAALRPVSTHADDDDDMDAFDLPPRFVAPAPARVATAGPASHAVAQPDAETSEPVAAADGADEPDDETRVLADGYSSLLDLSRPPAARQQFVRIEEPEDTAAAIEPVVVFPGQSARSAAAAIQPAAQTSPFAAPGPRLAAGGEVATPGVRRFDSPPAGATAAKAVSDHDAEEAERALRAALATLQRMSAVS